MYLSLPIPSTKTSKVSIHHCLDAFVGAETMEKSDAWYVILNNVARFPRRVSTHLKPLLHQELPTMQNTA